VGSPESFLRTVVTERPPKGAFLFSSSDVPLLRVDLPTAATITINPLANRSRADACGFGDGLRRLPARNLPYNPA
jgi:hypothetical protein